MKVHNLRQGKALSIYQYVFIFQTTETCNKIRNTSIFIYSQPYHTFSLSFFHANVKLIVNKVYQFFIKKKV